MTVQTKFTKELGSTPFDEAYQATTQTMCPNNPNVLLSMLELFELSAKLDTELTDEQRNTFAPFIDSLVWGAMLDHNERLNKLSHAMLNRLGFTLVPIKDRLSSSWNNDEPVMNCVLIPRITLDEFNDKLIQRDIVSIYLMTYYRNSKSVFFHKDRDVTLKHLTTNKSAYQLFSMRKELHLDQADDTVLMMSANMTFGFLQYPGLNKQFAIGKKHVNYDIEGREHEIIIGSSANTTGPILVLDYAPAATQPEDSE